MDADGAWCASALARTEVLLVLQQMAVHPRQQDKLWATARRDWDGFWVVPVDGRCLSRAVEIGATYGVATLDAVHLGRCRPVAPPLRYATFDRRQIPAAVGLGFEVVSPLVGA